MRYELPYADVPGGDVPDTCEVVMHRVHAAPDRDQSPAEIIQASLAAPVASPPLAEHLGPSDTVLVLVDDISRPTPAALVVAPLLAEIARAGIPDNHVSFLVALGTHRPMTRGEMEAKLGADVVARFRVANHEWNNPAELHDYGTLADGTRVILNKALHEASFVIGVGSITPHPAAGFTGGGKIVVPGVATDEAAGAFHWNSVQVPQKDVLGIRDNPMRAMIDEIAALAGLDFIVNVVLDGTEQVAYCVSGDPVQAHEQGARLSLGIWGVPVAAPESVDVFITDTYPMDQDLWQAAKALCALDTIVPDGAVVVLVSGAEEGIAPMHPEVLEYGYRGLEAMGALVDCGKVNKIVGHYCVQGGRLFERTHPFLVTPTVSAADARQLGFRDGFDNLQAAIDAALALKGPRAKVMIFHMGSEIVPVVRES